MNCKPGDLAVVIHTNPAWTKHIGRLVRVLEPSKCLPAGHWLTDIEEPGYQSVHFWDGWLRPIRDNDQEDETLTWAGKPEKVSA
jgi:hypothetical protein